MLSRVKLVNETVDLTDCVIGSMDVKALYPSIDIDFAVEKCVEMIIESDVKFQNVNTDELGLYLSLTVDKRDLERVQKVAVRIIVGKNYTNYKENLLELNFKNLNIRRENICLNFA